MMALGLEDNWSEIRYSASVSLRSFYQISKKFREDKPFANRYTPDCFRIKSKTTCNIEVSFLEREWDCKIEV